MRIIRVQIGFSESEGEQIMSTKLTKTQQSVIDKAMSYYNEANAMDFETWCWKSKACGGSDNGSYESVLANWKRMGRLLEKPLSHYIDFYRSAYEQARAGIVVVNTSSNTLRALERKGYIEIIKDGGRNLDTIRLLNV